MKPGFLFFLALSLTFYPLSGQNKTASSLLSSAIYEEEVSGNLEKATELYQDILKKYADDRPVAAKALYHLGLTSEKLGHKKADEYYTRLINTYPDQKEMVALARGRLDKSEVKNVFTDSRDGHKYRYVTIGAQTWMAENLAYIPHVNPKMKQEHGIWVNEYDGWDIDAAKATQNYKTYGCLYDWPTAMGLDSSWLDRTWPGDPVNRQGICPPGWHLPTDDEWKALEKFLGMPEMPLHDIKYARSGKSEIWTNLPEYPPVGRYLKSNQGWNGPGTGDNSSGFNALPAGTRLDSPPFFFLGLGNWAYFWSSSIARVDPATFVGDQHDLTAWSRELPGTSEDDYRMFTAFKSGQSVRCIMNQPGKDAILPLPDSAYSNQVSRNISKYNPEYGSDETSTDWSRLGGNSRNTGFVSGQAPQNKPEILWSIKRNIINNAFVIADGKLFLCSADSSVSALDAESGQEIWRIKLGSMPVGRIEVAKGNLVIFTLKKR